ncbi:MAG: sugar ABC transporter substrate-binding protein [Ignavibacteriaceae bacterium]
MKASIKKNIRTLFQLTLIILFGITALRCNSNNGKVQIDFWAMGAEAEHVQKLMAEFEKENPGIKVKVQAIPWTAAHEKLITAYASETTPDIVQLGNTWIPEFVALNSLEDLGKWVKMSDEIKEQNYFPGIWQTNIIDNHLYGIPWYVDTRVLFYRKDILREAGYSSPPKTWKELFDLSEKIKKIENRKNKYAIFLPTNEWAPFIIFGLQSGSTILKDNNTLGNFSGEKFKKSFSYLINFYKEGLAPLDMTQVSNIYQAFAQGFFSMYITGPWNVTEFKKRLPEDLQNKWMTAPLPSYDSVYPGKSLAGGSSFVMFKLSKNKNAAWKLIEFLSSRKSQIEFYNLSSDLPAVKNAWDDSSLKDDKYLNAFYEQLQNVVPTPKVPEWEQIVSSKVQQYAEYAARNKMTIDEALKNLDHDVDIILEKRRWILNKVFAK